jgi:hypothetical protein
VKHPEDEWVERLEELVVERPGLTTVVLVVVLGLCALTPWAAAAGRASVAAHAAKMEADVRAIRAHLRWLRDMPDAEKARWPVVEVCRPGTSEDGACRCEHWQSEVVSFAELRQNGDVVCHQTR